MLQIVASSPAINIQQSKFYKVPIKSYVLLRASASKRLGGWSRTNPKPETLKGRQPPAAGSQSTPRPTSSPCSPPARTGPRRSRSGRSAGTASAT